MEIITLEQPTIEPVTYQEAKDQLRIDIDREKELIVSYIQSAREYCENYQNRTYLTKKLKLIKNNIHLPLEIPLPPLQEVEKIEFQKKDGSFVEWSTDNYVVDTSGEFGWIRTAETYTLPDINFADNNRFQITFYAGHENRDDVSPRIKNAIKLMVTHWFENRTPVVIGTISTEVEFTIHSLLASDRVVPV